MAKTGAAVLGGSKYRNLFLSQPASISNQFSSYVPKSRKPINYQFYYFSRLKWEICFVHRPRAQSDLTDKCPNNISTLCFSLFGDASISTFPPTQAKTFLVQSEEENRRNFFQTMTRETSRMGQNKHESHLTLIKTHHRMQSDV